MNRIKLLKTLEGAKSDTTRRSHWTTHQTLCTTIFRTYPEKSLLFTILSNRLASSMLALGIVGSLAGLGTHCARACQ
jgi:hypothetical protein